VIGNEPLDVAPAPARGSGPAPAPPPRDLEGPGPQQWGVVHAVRISNDGLVYMADRGNSGVQVFTLDGKYQTQVFVNRKDKNAATVCGLALSADPHRSISTCRISANGHVWILDRKSLTVLGHFGEQGPEPGNFRNAHHMTTDTKEISTRPRSTLAAG